MNWPAARKRRLAQKNVWTDRVNKSCSYIHAKEKEKEKKSAEILNRKFLEYLMALLQKQMTEYDFSEVFNNWKRGRYKRTAAYAINDIETFLKRKQLDYDPETLKNIQSRLALYIHVCNSKERTTL